MGAEAAAIEGEALVKQAELKAAASKIEVEARLSSLKAEQEAEVTHRKALDTLEVQRSQALAEIESKKFADTVAAIAPETLVAIAQAGPEMQAKLLGGLGLKGYLVTDGKSP